MRTGRFIRPGWTPTLGLPVKVRVLTLESDLGVPEITNADNGQGGTGAVWDFTPQLSGAPLATMKLSAARTRSFRVSDLRPLAQGKDFKRRVLNLDTRVFGNLHKEKSAKDEDKDEDSEEKKDEKKVFLGGARCSGGFAPGSRFLIYG